MTQKEYKTILLTHFQNQLDKIVNASSKEATDLKIIIDKIKLELQSL
jgi:hypothetical protein